MEKITKNQLKSYIKGVIRESLSECEYKDLLKEVSPPGKKAERMIHHVKASLRKAHPEWNEDKVTSVAIATGWKSHNKGDVEEAGLTSEDKGDAIPKGKLSQLNPKIVSKDNKKMTAIDPKKSLAQKFLKRLKESGMTIQKNVDEGGPQYKVASPTQARCSNCDQAREIQYDPKMTENHKVQHRSSKTVNDLDNDPQNVRDPEVPQA